MLMTDLTLVGGLPYSRRIRVKKAAITWPTTNDFEVRSQVRVSASKSATLKATLTPYISASVDGEDIVLDLHMNGGSTRTLSGGYYDIVLSDKGSMDSRAIRVLGGKLTIQPLVTGE